ncbi:DUF1015 domain-containing protein [Frankia sp. Ag45/Mut15]|uniref:DUF1015 domain-containing protein n=1 Tax=Frankia umida TaxID=573489 RepID=A0ABT0K1R4_9ACTN|nr:DUF1015 domain-containing protein [Frankia umida]MCK9877745.1 DUF1015 domain-containing protein [Frankia umida]
MVNADAHGPNPGVPTASDPAPPAAAPPAAVPGPTSVPEPAGLVLAPIRAARFDVDGAALAARTSPPYDIIDEAERARLWASDEHNVVRLILPGDDYPAAAATLRDWLASGVLRRDERPAVYVCEEEQDGHVQRGLIGAVALADPAAGIILPHENTMAGPVADRLALTQATEANLEPIFLLYAGGGPTSRLVATVVTTTPTVETTTDDGVTHRLWLVDDPATLDAVAADLLPRRAVIADGHHRYATYRQYQAQRHAAGDGPGPWDFGLAFLVDATVSGPRVHAIHRSIGALPLAEAVRRASAAFTVRPLTAPPAASGATADGDWLLAELAAAGRHGPAFVLTDGATSHLLTAPDPALLARSLPADRSEAFRRLDVTIAHLALIVDVWGLPDTVDVVDYHHDVPAAIAAAAAAGGTALLLNPTPVEDVTAVAQAGERMPRKSTLFTPKPRTGLLLRPLVS